MYRSSTSPLAVTLSNMSLSAAFEWVTTTVRWSGNDRKRLDMTWTATSVFPVPGGPTTRVRPALRPDRTADTWAGVNRTALPAAEGGRGYGSAVTVPPPPSWPPPPLVLTLYPLLFPSVPPTSPTTTSRPGNDSLRCPASTNVSP